jgi:hypothetical protein
MAVYKVIQDIEAEDKLIGFLTLKGFIYAAIAGTLTFIEFRLLFIGTPLKWLFILMFLGPIILFGVLASPLGREQPTEVWLLSRVRFFFKPRRRVWDQSGVNNLVTITAPKRIEHQLTKNLSQTEVHSRLQALASTLDSRGWAVKNATLSVGAAPSYLEDSAEGSDRLIEPSSLPQNTQVIDIHAADDIMDEQNNPTAQNFAALMQQADTDRKKSIVDKINAARAGDSTFLDQPATPGQDSLTVFVGRNIVAPAAADDNAPSTKDSIGPTEKQFLDRLHREETELERRLPKNFRVKSARSVDQKPVTKTAASTVTKAPASTPPNPVTPEMQAAKLELAQSGNDLSVASIAHLANHKNQMQRIGPNEFVIALH